MREPTWFEKLIDKFFSLFERYNCKKEKHRWGYKLSETGMIYINQDLVPDNAWFCLDCSCRKEWWIKNNKNK